MFGRLPMDLRDAKREYLHAIELGVVDPVVLLMLLDNPRAEKIAAALIDRVKLEMCVGYIRSQNRIPTHFRAHAKAKLIPLLPAAVRRTLNRADVSPGTFWTVVIAGGRILCTAIDPTVKAGRSVSVAVEPIVFDSTADAAR